MIIRIDDMTMEEFLAIRSVINATHRQADSYWKRDVYLPAVKKFNNAIIEK